MDPELAGEVSPEQYARGDEAWLHRGRPGVRVAVLRDRCVSFGVGVDPRAPFVRRAEEERIPVVARSTGGSGLLHEAGDLAWSTVRSRDDPLVGADYPRAFERLGRGVVRWLATLGLDGDWVPAPRRTASYCTLSDRGSVLAIGGSIVGGAAQHMARGVLLHHGTVSVGIDRAAIDRLFELPAPSPSADLGCLRELGVRAPSPELARGLAQALSAEFPG